MMLGHANLKSTEIYTHLSIKELKEAHRKYHPARMPEAEGKLAVVATNR
jgi:integrase/recombinase XerD